MRGKGKGMSGMGMGAVGMGCKRQPKEIDYRKCQNIVREHPATPSPLPKHHVLEDPSKNVVPRSPGVHIKKKMPLKNNHRAEGMAERINIRDAVSTNIRWYYKCKDCAFECATRAACVAHARREHTDELIGPCNYCGSFYAHSADMMKHHVNECVGSDFSWWLVCSLQVINKIVNNFSTIIIIKFDFLYFYETGLRMLFEGMKLD